MNQKPRGIGWAVVLAGLVFSVGSGCSGEKPAPVAQAAVDKEPPKQEPVAIPRAAAEKEAPQKVPALPNVNELRKQFENEEKEARRQLMWPEEKVKGMIRDLQSHSAKNRRWAVGKIGEYLHDVPEGKKSIPIPVLLEMLEKDPDLGVRADAGCILGAIGPDAKAAVPILAKALKDPVYANKTNVFNALGNFGPAAAEAVPELRAILRDPTRARDFKPAVVVLRGIGPLAKDSVPELLQMLRNPPQKEPLGPTPGVTGRMFAGWMKIEVLDALGKIHALPERSVPAVVNVLIDEGDARDDPTEVRDVRAAAARCLGEFGPEAKGAMAALAATVERRSKSTPNLDLLVGSLRRIGPDAVPTLVSLLDNELVRHEVIAALGEMGPPAKEALPRLRKLVPSKDERAMGVPYRGILDAIEKIEK